MTPVNITLNQKNQTLEITWPDDQVHQLSSEYLRVSSPSAEVQGHGPGQETLQLGKENIKITAIEPVGNYAIKLVFDDNHDSGIFSWDYLRKMGDDQESNWKDYLQKCDDTGYVRKEKGQVI